MHDIPSQIQIAEQKTLKLKLILILEKLARRRNEWTNNNFELKINY